MSARSLDSQACLPARLPARCVHMNKCQERAQDRASARPFLWSIFLPLAAAVAGNVRSEGRKRERKV